MSRLKQVFIGLLGFVLVWGMVHMFSPTAKQATATGLLSRYDSHKSQYWKDGKPAKCEVPPTWGGVIPGEERFVPTFVDEEGVAHAYIDCQTGLVWDAAPEFFEGDDRLLWNDARVYCANRTEPWLGQKGGRLPSMAELASLVDTTSALCTGGGPCLPDGHPFGDHVHSAVYWSASTFAANTMRSWNVFFNDGKVGFSNKDILLQAWCLRGAMQESEY